MVQQDELIPVRVAAQECRRTAETVRRWIWSGRLPAQKLGNQLFVSRTDLARLCRESQASDRQARLAALEAAIANREQIRQRIGGDLDVLDALDRSRAAHP